MSAEPCTRVISPPPTEGDGSMLRAGVSTKSVCEFCRLPAACDSPVRPAKKLEIEKMLAEASKGATSATKTPDDASANHNDLLNEFFDVKALV